MTTATLETRMKNPLLMFPGAFEGIQAIQEATSAGGVPDVTRYMVHLRASQINGCAGMHSREMREVGESDERIFADEPAVAALLIEIGLINVWNRVNAATRQVARSHKA